MSGVIDPLLSAATRFVAARPFTGPRALMHRFGIGLQRARWLLVELEEKGVVCGHWSRLLASGHGRGGTVYSFRVYRVRPWSWAVLPQDDGPPRWVRGIVNELEKFAALDDLFRVQGHAWFVEGLLAKVAAWGLRPAQVEELRRQLINAQRIARRRLVPGWQSKKGMWSADYFGLDEAEVAVMR
ncbi:hypothetical protein K2E95_00215 [Pseudomonas sp. ERGC3:01]|nr:hypothetical protein [Pseudomonas sp. ERGC3:01]